VCGVVGVIGARNSSSVDPLTSFFNLFVLVSN
jgi:hypothetical protein